MEYRQRLLDERLDLLITILPAIALEGAKGVGKTATAERRAATVFALDREATFENVSADPDLVLAGHATTLIDEWSRVPSVWDVVRRAVDHEAEPGRFLLAGSAAPPRGARLHSGAGRIVKLTMRPLTIPERDIEQPTVSFAALYAGDHPEVTGLTVASTPTYVEEILTSGFPGIRQADPRARSLLLDSYLDRIVDHDFEELGIIVKRPASLRNWMAAYAAATATTASYSAIGNAATPGEAGAPSRPTAQGYREALLRMSVLDPLPAWVPGFAHLKRLAQAPKHHLVDPALAARLVGASASSLIRGTGEPDFPRDGTFLGALFESLVVQTVRVLAEHCGGSVAHCRTLGGDHEIDLIVQRPDFQVLAIEVKLSPTVRPADVTHLHWLATQIPGRLVESVIVNTGPQAYRRPDGIAVIPLALLGA